MITALKRFRGEFVTRLNALIVLQGLFVIVGLIVALFLAAPPEDINTAFGRVTDSAGKVGHWLEALGEEHPGRAADLALPDSLLRGLPTGAVLQYHLLDPDDKLNTVHLAGEYDDGDPDTDDTREPLEEYVQSALDAPPGATSVYLVGRSQILAMRTLATGDGQRGVLSVKAEHDNYVADMRYLSRATAALFAAGLLVTLLLVLLVRRHFQIPLRRLTSGIERTSAGGLVVVPQRHDDRELDDLARSFSRISHSLWTHQNDMREANLNLRKLSSALLESQLFLASLVDAAPLCIMAASTEGEIILFNRQACRDFACTAGEARNRRVGDFFAKLTNNDPQSVGSTDQASGTEMICRRIDGSEFPAFVVACPVRTEAGQPVASLYMIKDISESTGFQDMMIRLDRYYTRGEMAGDIAHEINNYLSILLGNLELLPLFLKKGNREKIDEKLELMRNTTNNIARFTDGLMDGSTDEPQFADADLNQLVANVIAFLKPQNRFDRVDIHTSLDADVPIVSIDSGQVQQLIVNLVYNAAEALSVIKDDRTITVTTAVDSEDPDSRVTIEVSDNGPGVDAEKEALLFNKRFTTKCKGHGIGLVTCKRIADMHGGEMSYRYSEGAVFSVRLPVRARSDHQEPDSRAVSQESTSVVTA
jgi:PAS domain S-box-containing protein